MVTGIVTRLPVVCRMTCPVNVPAVMPPPGSLAGATLTCGADGAVPLAGEMVSQAPPSAVLVVAVQASVPVPALRISSACGGGPLPFVTMEKVSCPGRVSKYVAVAGSTVSVTGIVMLTLPTFDLTRTSAEYVPAASVVAGFTLTVIACGVEVQQP